MVVGGVRLGVWGLLVVCVCVSVSGVLFSVGVCVRDLLIFSRIPVAQPHVYEYCIPPAWPCKRYGYVHIQAERFHRRFIYKGDTSTHAHETDPRVAVGA